MLHFLKKIRNWFVTGEFISIYIITYKCDNIIDTFTIKANNKYEAIKHAYEKGSKMACNLFEILEVIEF